MSVRILLGDVREKLAELADESVHCVVTSPPYFGLRDYGTASWEGGDPACDHKGSPRQSQQSTLAGNGHGNGKQLSPALQSLSVPFGHSCGKCGAARADKQIGLEATPEAFVAVLVEVFREVRRVLRRDGTLWLNLGDSYAGGGTIGRNDTTPEALARRAERYGTGTGNGSAVGSNGTRPPVIGLKQKDLIGIPWRVAFALQADGWYLRQDIVWSKPNPMPESVTDRCTKAHEYLFLLSRSPRYYYDAEAIAEPETMTPQQRLTPRHDNPDAKVHGMPIYLQMEGGTGGGTRNKRSVWTVATQPFKGAHFATFPPDLIEPCIKAGCPKGGVVLDPFGGAGTTGLVADRLQRSAILIELNPAYLELAQARITDDAPLFAALRAGYSATGEG